MKRAYQATVIALSGFATYAGFVSSSGQQIPEPTVTADSTVPARPIQPKASDSLPAFDIGQPFDARHELDRALAAKDANEKIGRFMAIGFHAAQTDPEQNLERLSPEIWDAANYDLRGTFYAEWMRLDPNTFLRNAETTFAKLDRENSLGLFPSYHLAYLEPLALLDLIPKIQNEDFLKQVCDLLVDTLVELDPELLWQRYEGISNLQSIIDSASHRNLFALALEFWKRSEWQEVDFDHEVFEYIARENLHDYASRLQGFRKTLYATAFGVVDPTGAAKWVRTQPTLEEFEYMFDSSQAAFFKELLDLYDFNTWTDAPLWIREAINADDEVSLYPNVFRAIASNPDALQSSSLKTALRDYIPQIENQDAIKRFYLALPSDHPALDIVEKFMLMVGDAYSSTIIARTSREAPTPARLLKTLQLGNVLTWPNSYVETAAATIASLSDEELLWSLNPSSLLAAHQISPDRIQNLIDNADPLWLETTLNSARFVGSVNIDQLAALPALTRDLPPENGEHIFNEARKAVFNQVHLDPDKTRYVSLAKDSQEASSIVNSIGLETFEKDQDLKTAIDAHPLREDFYLALASKDPEALHSDPNIQAAAERLQRTRDMLRNSPESIVSTIQTLPDSDQFATAKAVMFAENRYNPITTEIVELEIWTDSQKRELYNLSYRNLTNYSLQNMELLLP